LLYDPAQRFKGTFPGNMVLSRNGRYLYVVDQGAFQVHAIDTTKIATGVDASGNVLEPDNFAAVISRTKVGHYPFGIALSPDERTLLVTNVGVFQYTHLRPPAPVGDKNVDYPLCIPAMGYPDEVKSPKTINIHKIDASTVSGLPKTFRVPDGIRDQLGRQERRHECEVIVLRQFGEALHDRPGLPSGVCLPFCSKTTFRSVSLAPGAVTATSSGADCPTYFTGLAISMTGPGRRPA